MWHASVSSRGWIANDDDLYAYAADALLGVGDAALGEWREAGGLTGCVHLKRRLTPAEQQLHPEVREVRDVRRTWEGHKRVNRMEKHLAPGMRGLEV